MASTAVMTSLPTEPQFNSGIYYQAQQHRDYHHQHEQSNDRDTHIQGRESLDSDLLSDPAQLIAYVLDGASTSDSHTHSRGLSESRRRERELAYATLSREELLNTLVNKEYEGKRLLKALRVIVRHTNAQRARIGELERDNQEALERLRQVNQSRVEAQEGAARSNHEVQLYRIELENARRELLRGAELLRATQQQRDEAEQAAARARGKARRLRQQRLVDAAREEGRRWGFHDGFEHAKQTYLLNQAMQDLSLELDNSQQLVGGGGGDEDDDADADAPQGELVRQGDEAAAGGSGDNGSLDSEPEIIQHSELRPPTPRAGPPLTHGVAAPVPHHTARSQSPRLPAPVPFSQGQSQTIPTRPMVTLVLQDPLYNTLPPREPTDVDFRNLDSRVRLGAVPPEPAPRDLPQTVVSYSASRSGMPPPPLSVRSGTHTASPLVQVYQVDMTDAPTEVNHESTAHDQYSKFPRKLWVTAQQHKNIKGSIPSPSKSDGFSPTSTAPTQSVAGSSRLSQRLKPRPSLKDDKKKNTWYRTFSFRKKMRKRPVIDLVDDQPEVEEEQDDDELEEKAMYDHQPGPSTSWYHPKGATSDRRGVIRRPSSPSSDSTHVSQMAMVNAPDTSTGNLSRISSKEAHKQKLKEKESILSVIKENPLSREATPASNRVFDTDRTHLVGIPLMTSSSTMKSQHNGTANHSLRGILYDMRRPQHPSSVFIKRFKYFVSHKNNQSRSPSDVQHVKNVSDSFLSPNLVSQSLPQTSNSYQNLAGSSDSHSPTRQTSAMNIKERYLARTAAAADNRSERRSPSISSRNRSVERPPSRQTASRPSNAGVTPGPFSRGLPGVAGSSDSVKGQSLRRMPSNVTLRSMGSYGKYDPSGYVDPYQFQPNADPRPPSRGVPPRPPSSHSGLSYISERSLFVGHLHAYVVVVFVPCRLFFYLTFNVYVDHLDDDELISITLPKINGTHAAFEIIIKDEYQYGCGVADTGTVVSYPLFLWL
ncbi:hypothetical protein AMATHDRAFT_51569 [Amanita thiersii Skay4041]|uniref:Uncharacterized protein n=1 Tax=Amanita thiersii Skay4041 TaxID=703135 RepID=A0A2A9N6X0_9AGAR|nr:hypothetical protein AMATHDRAFT_51569 [Amanita thiersii Skay4041]